MSLTLTRRLLCNTPLRIIDCHFSVFPVISDKQARKLVPISMYRGYSSSNVYNGLSIYRTPLCYCQVPINRTALRGTIRGLSQYPSVKPVLSKELIDNTKSLPPAIFNYIINLPKINNIQAMVSIAPKIDDTELLQSVKNMLVKESINMIRTSWEIQNHITNKQLSEDYIKFTKKYTKNVVLTFGIIYGPLLYNYINNIQYIPYFYSNIIGITVLIAGNVILLFNGIYSGVGIFCNLEYKYYIYRWKKYKSVEAYKSFASKLDIAAKALSK
jgi:hypothetical protein